MSIDITINYYHHFLYKICYTTINEIALGIYCKWLETNRINIWPSNVNPYAIQDIAVTRY